MFFLIFILDISYVITTVRSINSLISGSCCIYFLLFTRLIQTELGMINIDYDLNPLTHNMKKWPNLTNALQDYQTCQENVSIFMMQIVLVCVTIFGHMPYVTIWLALL